MPKQELWPGSVPLSPESKAVLLLPLCDELQAVGAAVALVTVAAAKGEEVAVKARVPRTVLVPVPQAVFIRQACGERSQISDPPGPFRAPSWGGSPPLQPRN